MLTVISMFSPCAQWLFGPLSPVFSDLYQADFISAIGRVSRRKLERLHASPYQHTLLRRGISKREEEEECKPSLCHGMEYAGAIGVGLLEIIEELTHQYEVQVSALDLAVMDMDKWVQDSERRLVNLGGVADGCGCLGCH